MVYSFLLTIFADELLQVKKESEKSIQEITHERNALQEKVKSSVNLSEKQLRELYNTMEDKSQRIANLEQDLIDVHKKDEKISELELEINILRGIRCYFVERSMTPAKIFSELSSYPIFSLIFTTLLIFPFLGNDFENASSEHPLIKNIVKTLVLKCCVINAIQLDFAFILSTDYFVVRS